MDAEIVTLVECFVCDQFHSGLGHVCNQCMLTLPSTEDIQMEDTSGMS